MRWAFKLAYIGHRFHGFQRQPDLQTVEGDILEVLLSKEIIDDPRQSGFQSASRTDRNVSALGNVSAFDSPVDGRKIIATLNASLTDIWFYAYTRVSSRFSPRKAEERWYRYHFPGELPIEELEDTAGLFEGRHDFRIFCKGRTTGICDVREVRLTRLGDRTILDIRADRFLWNMVRRVAGCLQMVANGELEQHEVEGALGGNPISIRLVPPEYLWLMDVSYAFPFQPFPTIKVRETILKSIEEKKHQVRFLSELLQRMGEPRRSRGAIRPESGLKRRR
ncbi:MAG: tRNA pseudouridine(38-40) synthase TruA [Candidatus Thermoplasmatota archaeon]|nr:tRNA pseudouridine(38-40) synthase TruA [Candidatus Thermoplasmatota archaeon]